MPALSLNPRRCRARAKTPPGPGCPSSASARTAAAGLSPAAQAALDGAELVVGGARHLALAQPLAAETLAWPSPIADALPEILARRGRPTCVLATGDPFPSASEPNWRASSRPRRWRASRSPPPSAWPRRGSAGPCRSAPGQPAWPRAGAHRAASAAGRAHPRAVLGWLDAGQASRPCSRSARLRRLGRSPCWRRWAARASASGGLRRAPSTSTGVDPLNTIAVEVVAARRRPRRHPRARPRRQLVRERRPAHEARCPRRHPVGARAARGRAAVGRRRWAPARSPSNGCLRHPAKPGARHRGAP